MDIKDLTNHIDEIVRYDHKNLGVVYFKLIGIFTHKVNGYLVSSAVLLDKSGSTYYAMPSKVSAMGECKE